MVPIREAAVVDFIHWLNREHPNVRGASSLSEPEFMRLAQAYEHTHPRSADILPQSQLYKKWIDVYRYLRDEWAHFRFKQDTNRARSRDALARYRDVPFKAMFFLTSEDKIAKAYIDEHWDALDGMSGRYCDIYVCQLGDAYRQMAALSNIPGVFDLRPADLPCLLVWTNSGPQWFKLKLSRSDVAAHEMTATLRGVFGEFWEAGAPARRLPWWPSNDAKSPDAILAKLKKAGSIARTRASAPLEEVDVFISYKRRLRHEVDVLAEDLKRIGLKVWYDRELEAGTAFQAEIATRLRKAAVVIVCWSADAFAKGGDKLGWVTGEAMWARERAANGEGAYIPVLIEPTDLDPPFNGDHTLNFHDWFKLNQNARADAEVWKRLLAGVHPWRIPEAAG